MSRLENNVLEVKKLVAESMKLAYAPKAVEKDFRACGGHNLREEDLSTGSKAMLSFYERILGETDFVGIDGHDSRYAKKFETTKKLLACHAMNNALSGGMGRLAQEATTAGVALPTFTRQLLLTISRAYARLFTPELFGVIPLTGPTGRIHFKDYLYDNTYVGSTPTIVGGTDRIDDITKFNPNYYVSPEGAPANKQTFRYTNMDVSTVDYRVIAEWTDTLADDAMSVYDDSADQSLMNQMSQEMARLVDRLMITAMINAVPSANQYDFTGQPTSNPNYPTLTPSEKQAYDELLYRVGINTTISKIRVTRKYNNDGDPDWAVIGTDFALALNKLTFFQPFERNISEIGFAKGALRDLGQVKSVDIRFLVDPMLAVTVQNATADTTGASHAYFGRTPQEKNDTGIYWLPYINLQPTRDLYDPQTGTTTKGTRSRFAIAQPNTGVQPNSSQLGEVYGRLRIV